MTSQIFPAGDEHPYNTTPEAYIVPVVGEIHWDSGSNITPSSAVVTALQKACPEIQKAGFRQRVLDAIWDDAVAEALGGGNYQERYTRRLRRWTKRNTRSHLIKHCEILDTWLHRDSRFVPDAYLIDKSEKTVVCYEVEDSHPLNPRSIGEYGAAWWCLEYIYWDLHLIAYDIYGNPRIVRFPESEFTAREVRKKHKHQVAESSDSDG